jgi:hypothetical protein
MSAAQVEFLGFPESTVIASEGPLSQYLRLSREAGGLIPQSMLPDAIGVSKSRVSHFVCEKRFDVHVIGGKNYVTADSFERFLLEERKSGRPWHKPTVSDLAKSAVNEIKRSVAEARRNKNK